MSRGRPWHGVAAPAPPTQYRRLAVMTGLLMAAFGVMAVQLVNLHVVEGPERRKEVERILLSKQQFTPLRGEIRDRNKEVLARSELVKEVKANPSLVGPQHAGFLAGYLAEPLGMDIGELTELLSRDKVRDAENNLVPRMYVRLKRGVSFEQWAQVRSNLSTLQATNRYPDLRVKGLEVEGKAKVKLLSGFRNAIRTEQVDQQIRIYPRGRLASHVLGFVGHDDDAGPNSVYATTGKEGLEFSMNPYLEGLGGWRVRRAIRRGGLKGFAQDEQVFQARPGKHVVLTLDSGLQAIVEGALASAWEAHSPTGLSAVVVDPRTGEVLAMANLPDFDPNHLESAFDWRRRNRAITDAFDPGSTAKALTFGLGLDSGLFDLDDLIDCRGGRFRHGKVWVRDDRPMGVVPVRTALARSSNIAASRTALTLTGERLYAGFKRFGLGEQTGIPLPVESGGQINPWESWDDWVLTRISFGYSLAVTPLQMTMAIAAIANEGRLMRPLLVKRIEDDEGQAWLTFVPEVRGQAISPEAARELVRGLQGVVEERGTGQRAALPHHGVAGKTGTAFKFLQGSLKYSDTLLFSSFVGFFPAEDPALCIGVFVDEPRGALRSGGAVAGPVFREIAVQAAEYMGIPPSAELPGRNLAHERVPGPLTSRLER